MHIRIGCELTYECRQPVPMVLLLNVHPSRRDDLIVPDEMVVEPVVPLHHYQDAFGNLCTRLLAPTGRIQLSTAGIVLDRGEPDPVHPDALQHAVEDLPDDVIIFLLGSRYCDSDRLSDTAWSLFGRTAQALVALDPKMTRGSKHIGLDRPKWNFCRWIVWER